MQSNAGSAALLTLLMLIAGRIVPSFTRNWLVRENPGRLPIPYGKFDGVAISISTAALCLWVAAPSGMATAAALFSAGILQLARIARWAGERTVREPLVLILHVAYAFVPAGFILTSLAALSDVQPSAGFHAWMAGGVGIMTLRRNDPRHFGTYRPPARGHGRNTSDLPGCCACRTDACDRRSAQCVDYSSVALGCIRVDRSIRGLCAALCSSPLPRAAIITRYSRGPISSGDQVGCVLIQAKSVRATGGQRPF